MTKRPRKGSHRRKSGVELLEDRNLLATLTVNVLGDDVDAFGEPIRNDGELTLRDAIAYVNGDFVPLPGDLAQIDETVDLLGTNDRIVFDDALFNANDEALVELMHSANSFSGLRINASVEIDAGSGRSVTLSAAPLANRRVLEIGTPNETKPDVTLTGLKITGGETQSCKVVLGAA